MKNQIEFGKYIQGLRKAKKYSLKIVADKLGIDISLLSKIERVTRNEWNGSTPNCCSARGRYCFY